MSIVMPAVLVGVCTVTTVGLGTFVVVDIRRHRALSRLSAELSNQRLAEAGEAIITAWSTEAILNGTLAEASRELPLHPLPLPVPAPVVPQVPVPPPTAGGIRDHQRFAPATRRPL